MQQPPHIRRRSSTRLPAEEWSTKASTRTPRLEQGHGFSDVSPSRNRKHKKPLHEMTFGVRLSAYFLRFARSPRGLALLGSLAFLWLCTSYIRANSTALASRPIPPAFLPLIRHSGNLIHHVSPAMGSRVKSYHDYQVASNPNRELTPEEVEARAQHTFHPNGLLLVNPRGRHPIQVLIERAEQRWKEKNARQSRTLQEAVREYKSRYRRNPPKGFDDWCVQTLDSDQRRKKEEGRLTSCRA